MSAAQLAPSKTHYRKAFNSPYLSSADIVEPTTLTVARVVLEPDKTKKTKDEFNTAYFTERELRPGEPLKPMILNAHNSRVMKEMCGSPWLEDWGGVVTVYVDKNVRFGRDTVEGLRLKPGGVDRITSAQVDTLEDMAQKLDNRAAFTGWLKTHLKVPHGELANLRSSAYQQVHDMLAKKLGDAE